MADLPIQIDEWEKNARESFRVTLDRFHDREIIEARVWWRDQQGELRPTKSGLSVSLRHLPKLAAALNAAMEQARRLGLLDDDA